MPKKSLAETHPEIAKQWHLTKNGGLTPNDVTSGSGKKIWWKCEKGDDHIWQSIVNNRRKGVSCPICSNRKAVKSNCLATTHPDLANQWHPTKNGKLTPFDITAGSNKKGWWKCDKGDDHQWFEIIAKRATRGFGCPICSNRKAAKANCLATTHPDLAKQWHPTKNGKLTTYDVTAGSGKRVWWKCDKGDDHEWQTGVLNRKKGTSCPICSRRKVVKSNCLATTHPDLANQWHPTKNGKLTPFDIAAGSGKRIWWKCDIGDDHEWSALPIHREKGTGCPMCANRTTVKSNCLATTHPDLANQWHLTKNGKLTPYDITVGSVKEVWWKCDKGDDHEWKTRAVYRNAGSGCLVCDGKKVVLSNCLATINPDLAKQWHPTKNGKLTPYDVSEKSGKSVWWKCEKGDDHEWKSTVGDRTNGNGCSVCSGKKVVLSNCLATINPDLANQWHPTKNGKLTPYDVGAGSGKKVWWKCDKGDDHEWNAQIGSRAIGNGCPFCTLTPQSKQELTITFELMKLFKNIDPKGLKTQLDGRLRAIDIFIPKLNLCVEFDGSYWHKEKRDIDKIKSEMLFEEGFKLIRVREEPLEKLYETDVISKQPYNGKQVTNDILSMIMSIFELDAKLVSKIKEYQSKEDLQNEKGLEKYIDKILTEKAEKK